MKFLRNPLIVAALGVLAVGAALWNVVAPLAGRFGRSRGSSSEASPPAPHVMAPPVGGPLISAAQAVITGVPIDREIITAGLREWVEAPRRDPFGVFVAQIIQSGPRAAELLALKAIWRQAGGQFAVINNVVLGEGEEIAGFKLERIDADCVWVRGTNGTERVEFAAVGAGVSSSSQEQP